MLDHLFSAQIYSKGHYAPTQWRWIEFSLWSTVKKKKNVGYFIHFPFRVARNTWDANRGQCGCGWFSCWCTSECGHTLRMHRVISRPRRGIAWSRGVCLLFFTREDRNPTVEWLGERASSSSSNAAVLSECGYASAAVQRRQRVTQATCF